MKRVDPLATEQTPQGLMDALAAVRLGIEQRLDVKERSVRDIVALGICEKNHISSQIPPQSPRDNRTIASFGEISF
ncbi:hypothetical protein [Sulfidibacter corallicola]|uniref:Uncharacterized protein n=1 Tax=Sulfidibacter corallicola TaxID=2818388 RepID=A0A8A4TKZ2_SULCO|nr:hypothetical protein [Sulfidibacter corallicola]QTD50147.1 hypothetical protein J3U87_31570 [Sulfidibacter corallicola]